MTFAGINRSGHAAGMVMLLFFIGCSVPGLFMNNESIPAMRSAFIDSGSMLESLLTMTEMDTLYNQNASFQSSTYGWVQNAVLFGPFMFMRYVLGMDPAGACAGYALVARLVSFVFTIGSLLIFCSLCRMVLGWRAIALVATALLAVFHPVAAFSFQLRPEPAGLFFLLSSLHCLASFLAEPTCTRHWKWAVFAGVLAMLSKTPFGIVLPVLGLAYAMVSRDHLYSAHSVKTVAATVCVACLLAGMVHPYLFIEYGRSIEVMRWLHHNHCIQDGVVLAESWVRWVRLGVLREYAVLLGLIASVAGLRRGRAGGAVRGLFVPLISGYNLLYVSVLFTFLRRPIGVHYFVPVYATLILAAAATGETLMRGRPAARVAAWAGALLLAVNASYHAARYMWTITDQATLRHTSAYAAGEAVRDIGEKPWRVVYFPSIPLSAGQFEELRNIYSFPHSGRSLKNAMRDFLPDMVVIRHMRPPDQREDDFLAAGRAAGLRERAVLYTGYPDRHLVMHDGPRELMRCFRAIAENLRRSAGGIQTPSASILTREPLEIPGRAEG